jgi:hypothetical protein
MDQRGKIPDRQKKKKIPPGAWMFVLCLLYKDSSMEREGQKDLKVQTDLKVQNGSKEKTGQKNLA